MKFIRTMHPAGFRSGTWAILRCTVPAASDLGRECYLVEFADSATDFWVVDDPDGHYEFTTGAALFGELP
jgi:hypothetical protein